MNDAQRTRIQATAEIDQQIAHWRRFMDEQPLGWQVMLSMFALPHSKWLASAAGNSSGDTIVQLAAIGAACVMGVGGDHAA